LEHELSGMFDVIHAEGLSVIWPQWARYVIDGTADRFSRFAVNVFGVSPEGKSEMETGLEGIRKFEEFMTEIGMPLTLSELGITLTEDSKKELAERCAKSTGGKKGSAKILFEKDMLNIYDSLK
ncbi:MAG: iron-containing alcohol dehydrogenase, partial [Clostridia bacterium]|nr:iron-containing alcohol dehydrogenase [Clostridia bacterium]